MIRCLLLLLLISAPALADEDLEKDLRDLQKQAESLIQGIDTSQFRNGSTTTANNLDLARRKIYALASDQKFLDAVNKVWASPERNKLFIIQGAWFIAIFLLRSWRQSKTTNWFKKIMIGLFFTVVLWAGYSTRFPRLFWVNHTACW